MGKRRYGRDQEELGSRARGGCEGGGAGRVAQGTWGGGLRGGSRGRGSGCVGRGLGAVSVGSARASKFKMADQESDAFDQIVEEESSSDEVNCPT